MIDLQVPSINKISVLPILENSYKFETCKSIIDLANYLINIDISSISAISMIFERVEEINISNMPIIVHPWQFIKKLRIKNIKYEKVEN